MKKLVLIPFFVFGLLCVQGQELTKEDYARAVSFMYDNYNNKTAFNLYTSVNWFKDGSGLWFIDYSKDKKTYKTVSFKKKKVELLFDHVKLSQKLSLHLEKELLPNKLSFSRIENNGKDELSFVCEGKTFSLNIETYELAEAMVDEDEASNPFESKSPDGKWIAYTKDYNLFIKSTETEEEFELSTKGEKGYEYASWYGWYDKM